ncbi:MAG: glycosyltransferase [Acidisphaera sp.]|nr:glycosyltransferase [Acidisphaera sp.]
MDQHIDASCAAPGDAVGPLLSPQLDPLFLTPQRRGVGSAWYGHVPFAHWIVAACRPRVLVELGSESGVSYSAFCETVLLEHLDTSCFAVDTWKGDEHAGFYSEDVYADLSAFHAAHYAGFSRLLRCTFDEARATITDASVDLLHIDGRHTYDDARHDFESWRPKLSDRAVVLFHDTNVRERDFGVWRFWAELRERFPCFEFLHAHGLGVLAHGEAVPEAVLDLCRIDDPREIGRVRERFAVLGERWVADFEARELGRKFDEVRRSEAEARNAAEKALQYGGEAREWAERTEARLAESIARRNAAEAARRTLQVQLADARDARNRAEQLAVAAAHAQAQAAEERAAAAASRADVAQAQAQASDALRRAAELQLGLVQEHAAAVEAQVRALIADKEILLNSTAWRMTRPFRAAVSLVPDRLRLKLARSLGRPDAALPAVALPQPAPPPDMLALQDESAEIEPAPSPATLESPAPETPPQAAAAAAPEGRRRILFISGEPETPGNLYRCVRHAESAGGLGWEASWSSVHHTGYAELHGVDVAVLWRTPWDDHIDRIVTYLHEQGAMVVFDVDDLMFKPQLATPEVIDGIRSMRFDEGEVRSFFRRVQRTLSEADLCTCTTPELARHMREFQKAVHVLPNGFDQATHDASRRAVRRHRQGGEDGLIRLGYAGGSRTHQRDMAVAVDGIARVLRERPDTRLVLFREPANGRGVVLVEEFEALSGLQERIEWRDMVPLEELPFETARFDINLAPLEVGNPFCEAKSELKYFEAALVDVPTVASPTGPYRRAIADGRTGFLADGPDAWHGALLRLVDDAALRRRVGKAAYHDALWTFGPHRRAEAMESFLAQFAPGSDAARAFELQLRRGAYGAQGTPDVPASEPLLEIDNLREAEVTVVIASYNYPDYILEALESVRVQTLDPLDLVVVDDQSPETGVVDLILEWARTHARRFNRLLVLRHRENAGLGGTRNSGFAAAETPYVLPLDADNRLRPECCATLLAALKGSEAAFAYPRIQQFDAADAIFSGDRFEPARLVGGNYIDAMALVSKWAWAAAGGYYVRREAMGWEDYDLWCRMVELGQWGLPVQESLAEYRVHATSMVNAITETPRNKQLMVDYVEQRHPWLDVSSRSARLRA